MTKIRIAAAGLALTAVLLLVATSGTAKIKLGTYKGTISGQADGGGHLPIKLRVGRHDGRRAINRVVAGSLAGASVPLEDCGPATGIAMEENTLVLPIANRRFAGTSEPDAFGDYIKLSGKFVRKRRVRGTVLIHSGFDCDTRLLRYRAKFSP